VARERCETQRAAFAEKIALVPLDKLVFLDECGFGLNLHRLYGWTIGGGRCTERALHRSGALRAGAKPLGGRGLLFAYVFLPNGDARFVAEVGDVDTSQLRGVFTGWLAASAMSGQRVGIGQHLDPSRGRDPHLGGSGGLLFALSAALLA